MYKYALELNVQEPYYSFIKSGQKIVEGRLAKPKYFDLKSGDFIKINDLTLKVKKVVKYSSFKQMIEAYGIDKIIPDAKDIESAINVYYKFYSKQDEQQFGVAGIEIELVK